MLELLRNMRKHTIHVAFPCKEVCIYFVVFRATLDLERSAVANLREQMKQGPLDEKVHVDIVILNSSCVRTGIAAVRLCRLT